MGSGSGLGLGFGAEGSDLATASRSPFEYMLGICSYLPRRMVRAWWVKGVGVKVRYGKVRAVMSGE